MTLLIIGFVIILCSVFIHMQSKDDYAVIRAMIHLLVIFGCVLMIFYGTESCSYKKGQVDAIEGKFEYEKHYIYPANDTIPVDSLYVEIEL